MKTPGRKTLPHDGPWWIDPAHEVYFLTLCCRERGQAQLTLPDTSRFILDAVAWRHEHRHWFAHVFLLMPDHCHALLSFPPAGKPWQEIVRDWKRWIARQRGVAWQLDFFDHRLRHDESFEEKARYILANPVRAGLVATWEDWPHRWLVPSR